MTYTHYFCCIAFDNFSLLVNLWIITATRVRLIGSALVGSYSHVGWSRLWSTHHSLEQTLQSFSLCILCAFAIRYCMFPYLEISRNISARGAICAKTGHFCRFWASRCHSIQLFPNFLLWNILIWPQLHILLNYIALFSVLVDLLVF